MVVRATAEVVTRHVPFSLATLASKARVTSLVLWVWDLVLGTQSQWRRHVVEGSDSGDDGSIPDMLRGTGKSEDQKGRGNNPHFYLA